MPAAKKTVTKAAEPVKTDIVETAPAAAEEAKKAPEVKEEAPKKEAPKKAPAKKAAASKKAAEPATKKTPAKKTASKKEIKTAVYVQYAGKEAAADALVAAAKKAYLAAGHKEDEIKTIDVYVKPEESAAYYAVNGEGSDSYKIVF